MMKHHSQTGLYKVGQPYEVEGKTYYPAEVAGYTEEGMASWYGAEFHGRRTANGESFDTYDMTAAHRTLPMPSVVRVTNLENGKTVLVRINDRGPFRRDRVIDVSQNASKALGFYAQGTAHVRIEFMPDESRIVAEAAKQGKSMSLADVAAQRAKEEQQAMLVASSPTQPNIPVPVGTAQQAPAADPGTGYQPAAYTVPVVMADTQPAAQEEHKNVLRAPAVYVQVGAYTSSAHAHTVAQKLNPLGAARVDAVTRDGVKLYRVRLAAANVPAGHRMLKTVLAKGYDGAQIIKN